MKIIVAFDSFKGSVGSVDLTSAAVEALTDAFPRARITGLPLSDGGDGFLDALAVVRPAARRIAVNVSDPLGRRVSADYLLDGDTAFIESAQACGLTLIVPSVTTALTATTRGVGEIMTDALARGMRRMVIALGGSATTDGGGGMLAALGGRLLDCQGTPIADGGASLRRLDRADLSHLHSRLRETEIVVLCDVDNPLTGPHGAAASFGRQKGADADGVELLDDALRRFASVMRLDASTPGFGAAGGLAASLAGVLGGKLRPGGEAMLRLCGFDRLLEGADLVITGEGRLDATTLHGKLPMAVMCAARAKGLPTVALAGAVDAGARCRLLDAGFADVASVHPGGTAPGLMMEREVTLAHLRRAVVEIAKKI